MSTTNENLKRQLENQAANHAERERTWETQMSELREENYRLLQALHEVAVDSEEASTVRAAVAALASSHRGLAYLQTNPI